MRRKSIAILGLLSLTVTAGCATTADSGKTQRYSSVPSIPPTSTVEKGELKGIPWSVSLGKFKNAECIVARVESQMIGTVCSVPVSVKDPVNFAYNGTHGDTRLVYGAAEKSISSITLIANRGVHVLNLTKGDTTAGEKFYFAYAAGPREIVEIRAMGKNGRLLYVNREKFSEESTGSSR